MINKNWQFVIKFVPKITVLHNEVNVWEFRGVPWNRGSICDWLLPVIDDDDDDDDNDDYEEVEFLCASNNQSWKGTKPGSL